MYACVRACVRVRVRAFCVCALHCARGLHLRRSPARSCGTWPCPCGIVWHRNVMVPCITHAQRFVPQPPQRVVSSSHGLRAARFERSVERLVQVPLSLACTAVGAPLAAHNSVFVTFDGRLGIPDRRTTIGRRTHGLKCNRHAGQLAHVHETLAWRAKDAVGSRVVFGFLVYSVSRARLRKLIRA